MNIKTFFILLSWCLILLIVMAFAPAFIGNYIEDKIEDRVHHTSNWDSQNIEITATITAKQKQPIMNQYTLTARSFISVSNKTYLNPDDVIYLRTTKQTHELIEVGHTYEILYNTDNPFSYNLIISIKEAER